MKKNNKKQDFLFFGAIVLSLVLIVIVAGNEIVFADSEKTIKIIASPVRDEGDAYRATVKIIVPLFDEKDEKIYEGNGTGWVAEIIKVVFYDENGKEIGSEKIALVVTNSHVVTSLVSGDHPELVKEPRAVVFYDENGKEISRYPFGVLVYSASKLKRQDVAVLGVVIPEELVLPVDQVADKFPEKGEEVTSIGFPDDSLKPVKKKLIITTSRGGSESFDGCSFSGESGPGDSGGPVRNKKHQLIGMKWGYVDYNLFFFKRRINYLVPIDELQSYIDRALTAAEMLNLDLIKLIKDVPIAQDTRE